MENEKRIIVVTGASGFVGKKIISELLKNKNIYKIFALVRKTTFDDTDIHEVITPDIGDTSWMINFPEKIDCIIHAAGLAHNKFETKTEKPVNYFRKLNTIPTKNLAELAAAKGVRRFIFISSIGVIGTPKENLVFDDLTPESPSADYAISKYEAEIEIKKTCGKTESVMDFVIIRPPLVYGSEAPGNFSKLLKLVQRDLPLPFLSVRNRRNFIDCENLANFIIHCINHSKASNQTFLIADDTIISTPELIRYLATGMNSKTTLFAFPVFLLKFLSVALRKKNIYEQLCCSFEVDCSRAKNLLQWTPPNTTHVALKKAAADFKHTH